LRLIDSDRYLELSRQSSGEVIARTITEWRRRDSSCNGALLWLLRDQWSGAGWGVIDSQGRPKPAYYHAKRVMQPFACYFSDEGVNGLDLHLINETTTIKNLQIDIEFLKHGRTKMASASHKLTLQARSTECIAVDSLVDHFVDSSFAYRFGPAGHDVVIAKVKNDHGELLDTAFWFPIGYAAHHQDPSLVVEAEGVACAGGDYKLSLTSQLVAQFVALDTPGFVADDNYFHLAPGVPRTLTLTPCDRNGSRTGLALRGSVKPLNSATISKIKVQHNG